MRTYRTLQLELQLQHTRRLLLHNMRGARPGFLRNIRGKQGYTLSNKSNMWSAVPRIPGQRHRYESNRTNHCSTLGNRLANGSTYDGGTVMPIPCHDFNRKCGWKTCCNARAE